MKEMSHYSARVFARGEREAAEDTGVACVCVRSKHRLFSKELKAEMRKHLKKGERLGSVGLGWPYFGEKFSLREGRNEFR